MTWRHFIFWVIFFDRFKEVRGWVLNDMFLVFGVVATSFGLAATLFGNAFNLSDIIAKGRLDYYLSLPCPVLLHTIASRSITSGLGDITYGIISFLFSGYFTWKGLGGFVIGVILSGTVFVAFMIIVHSLTFWLGDAAPLSQLLMNAMLTFALYPITLFDGPAKFILFTIVPAALMGSMPVSLIRGVAWGQNLGGLLFGTVALLGLAILIFHLGLRRYESGSAIQVDV